MTAFQQFREILFNTNNCFEIGFPAGDFLWPYFLETIVMISLEHLHEAFVEFRRKYLKRISFYSILNENVLEGQQYTFCDHSENIFW